MGYGLWTADTPSPLDLDPATGTRPTPTNWPKSPTCWPTPSRCCWCRPAAPVDDRQPLGAVGRDGTHAFTDNGPGIPAAVRSLHFRAFWHQQNRWGRHRIGLSFSYGVNETPTVAGRSESPSTGGARFIVILPLVPTTPAPAILIPPWSSPTPCPALFLIVDDERDIAEMFGELLTAAGHWSMCMPAATRRYGDWRSVPTTPCSAI